jgi:hypothetical protein
MLLRSRWAAPSGFIEPCLPSPAEQPPSGPGWVTPARWASKGIVSKRLGSRYRSGRSPDWLKMKNPDAPAVKREAEEDWGKRH